MQRGEIDWNAGRRADRVRDWLYARLYDRVGTGHRTVGIDSLAADRVRHGADRVAAGQDQVLDRPPISVLILGFEQGSQTGDVRCRHGGAALRSVRVTWHRAQYAHTGSADMDAASA